MARRPIFWVCSASATLRLQRFPLTSRAVYFKAKSLRSALAPSHSAHWGHPRTSFLLLSECSLWTVPLFELRGLFVFELETRNLGFPKPLAQSLLGRDNLWNLGRRGGTPDHVTGANRVQRAGRDGLPVARVFSLCVLRSITVPGTLQQMEQCQVSTNPVSACSLRSLMIPRPCADPNPSPWSSAESSQKSFIMEAKGG